MFNNRLTSQRFLGEESEHKLAHTKVGVVGLGGGGSHIVQQLAHVGVGQFVIADHDSVEEKNLNRLVGATAGDANRGTLKVDVAERLIVSVNPSAEVVKVPDRWQSGLCTLRACHVVFGCVDSFSERDQLEKFARHSLIPYIDVGMDVHLRSRGRGFIIGGQTVLSMPGGVCLWCLGILTEARLKQEAAQYGAAGSRPQVIWANGVLASLAVGLFTQLICPWHDNPIVNACCEFDGNSNTVESSRMNHLRDTTCPHFPPAHVGDRLFSAAAS